MSQKNKKDFQPVTKQYESNDYQSNDQASKGLAETHEQVSDTYMVGDMYTHDPSHQQKKLKDR
jgi:hypothetical protein